MRPISSESRLIFMPLFSRARAQRLEMKLSASVLGIGAHMAIGLTSGPNHTGQQHVSVVGRERVFGFVGFFIQRAARMWALKPTGPCPALRKAPTMICRPGVDPGDLRRLRLKPGHTMTMGKGNCGHV